MKTTDKRNRVSYYIGWGLAYGTFAGGMLGILCPERLLGVFFLGIAVGAGIGAIFGKRKLKK